MKTRAPLMPGCVLLPYDAAAGRCGACGLELSGRRTRWCSTECEKVFPRNHYWTEARRAAVVRDDFRCVKCGWAFEEFDRLSTGQMIFWSRQHLTGRSPANWLEVNHIVPRVGQGYGSGCWNHQVNLETLCHKCHVKVTRMQRIARARAA